MPVWNGLYHKNELDWMQFPVVVKTMTVAEIRAKATEFERSPAMERMRAGIENTINQVIERVFTTPIQFRFPKSKKRRIRKKWAKDPENFGSLLDIDQFGDIEIIGIEK